MAKKNTNHKYVKNNRSKNNKSEKTGAMDLFFPSRSVDKSEKEAKKEGQKNSGKAVKKPKKTAKKVVKKEAPALPVRIIPLGGLHEVGKNLTVVEYGEEMVIIDCGLMFPSDDMPGVDAVIPDFSYLLENKDKIKAIFLTHGHEDHIGGLPYLLKQLDLPIYGTKLTLGLVEVKLNEHKLNKNKLTVITPGSVTKLGSFSVEAIRVNHSIPDAIAFAIHTPGGTVVHTGDWKIDYDPVEGEMIDLARFAELGKQGVLALLSDSTNSERGGVTAPEKRVGETYDTLFAKAAGKRLIIASFSSNIHRIQQIMDKAKKYHRKVVVAGRSMENVTAIAQELGYLNVPKNVLIDFSKMNDYPKERIVVITTGAQGEPMAALSRMATGQHRQITVGKDDFIIISATPIPGNEKHVSKVVNELFELGAEVVYQNMYEVHTSGHACQDEQKTILGLVKPTYFIPVHGEYRHLMMHAKTAQALGVPEQNTLIAKNGTVIELTAKTMKSDESVPVGSVLVDGFGVGDVGSVVLRDRKKLSEDGLICCVIAVEGYNGTVISGPDLVSRGFVYVKESEELLAGAKEVVEKVLQEIGNVYDWNDCKNQMRDALSQYLYKHTGRSPMILPIIMNV